MWDTPPPLPALADKARAVKAQAVAWRGERGDGRYGNVATPLVTSTEICLCEYELFAPTEYPRAGAASRLFTTSYQQASRHFVATNLRMCPIPPPSSLRLGPRSRKGAVSSDPPVS